MKLLILRLAKLLGLFGIARQLTGKDLRILGYHAIWFLKGHFGDRLFMSAATFDARMEWLSKSPYKVLGLDQALERIRKGTLEKSCVVITIDDGWYGTYRYMLPVLERYALPATLYVYTGAVDSQRPLLNILVPALMKLSDFEVLELRKEGGASRRFRFTEPLERGQASDAFLQSLEVLDEDGVVSAVQQLALSLGFDYDTLVASRQFGFMTYEEIDDAAQRGLDIQLHSHSHRLEVEAPEKIESEIAVNRAKLSPFARGPLRHFCYPSGVHSPGMYGYLKRSGVLSATTVSTGLVSSNTEPYALKRILDGEGTTHIEFEAELSGFLELVRRTKRALKLPA
jgi:peptidoglycan/xylan/chitin deacetylase (PgdA/CDA1 family)